MGEHTVQPMTLAGGGGPGARRGRAGGSWPCGGGEQRFIGTGDSMGEGTGCVGPVAERTSRQRQKAKWRLEGGATAAPGLRGCRQGLGQGEQE